MNQMSRSRSNPPPASRPAGPKAAIDALLGGEASAPGNPLLRRALWLDALDLKLRPCLPPGLAAHARLANFDRGRLVYLVDAPVWHARLRLAATELLEAARSIGLEATDLVVKTSLEPGSIGPRSTGNSATVSPPPMSAAAREAFTAAFASRDEGSSGKDPS